MANLKYFLDVKSLLIFETTPPSHDFLFTNFCPKLDRFWTKWQLTLNFMYISKIKPNLSCICRKYVIILGAPNPYFDSCMHQKCYFLKSNFWIKYEFLKQCVMLCNVCNQELWKNLSGCKCALKQRGKKWMNFTTLF